MQTSTVYGQERAIRFLKNAIEKNQISHAYLFSGRKGVGKRLLAEQFAQGLLCENDRTFQSCSCQHCSKIASSAHADIRWIGADEGERTIKLAEVRAVQSWLALRPLEARRKVCIIHYAERMTEEAANAFLKTLEEPPQNSYIIFTVEHTFQLLDTILSRLVEVRLDPLPCEKLAEILQTEYGYGAESHFLAYQSQGSIGLAHEYKERDFFSLKNSILDSFLASDAREFFLGLVQTATKELDAMFHYLCGVFHDSLLLKYGVEQKFVINQDRVEDIARFAHTLRSDDIQKFLTLCEEARRLLKRNVNSKLILTNLAAQSEVLNR